MDPVDFMVAHWGKKYRDITALEAAADAEIRRLFAYTTSGLTPRAVDLNTVATGQASPCPNGLQLGVVIFIYRLKLARLSGLIS